MPASEYCAECGKSAESSAEQWAVLIERLQTVSSTEITRMYELTREAAAALAEAQERIARLEGRICLVCGRREPCKEAPDACTFDPSPIEAAQAFLKRAVAAENDSKRIEWMERNPCRANDLLDSVCGEWVKDRHKARTIRTAIDAAFLAAHL